MATQIKNLNQLLSADEQGPPKQWHLKMIRSEECLSYIAWNDQTREALAVDPKREDWDAYIAISGELSGYNWLGVIDTHTHADHISAAAKLAEQLKTALIMHEKAPSQRVHFRLSSAHSVISSQGGPVRLYHTPGHTPDSITVIWGPFLFGGDTLMYGDTGRDDLPGGDPAAHFDSLEKLKAVAEPHLIVLPGHDHKEGRASSWRTQLQVNPSLTQGREEFVRESSAFNGNPPRLLKESLRENFR